VGTNPLNGHQPSQWAPTLSKGWTVKPRHLATAAAAALSLAAAACGSTSGAKPALAPSVASPFLNQLHAVSQVASSVPGNGDVNPYGVAVVPASAGRLTAGDTLVSNFNDKANVQGTGTTIAEISPTGSARTFARLSAMPAGQACPGGIGLTTALGILPGGWVVVGSLPTTTGGVLPSLDPAGCLIVLNDQGTPRPVPCGPDQPADGIIRLPVAWPAFGSDRERLLSGILGKLDVAEHPHEGGQHPGPVLAEDPVKRHGTTPRGWAAPRSHRAG